MVKVGFIVEGDSERTVIESAAFDQFLKVHDFELVRPVIDAKGGGNLLPQNIGAFIDRLRQEEAEHIVVLTDLENEASTEVVKKRIENEHITVIFVAVKALDAWFLADTQAMRTWLGDDAFDEPHPENTIHMPWDRLKQIAAQLGKRGPANKVRFAQKRVTHYGFSISNAVQHHNCPSAKALVEYFKGR